MIMDFTRKILAVLVCVMVMMQGIDVIAQNPVPIPAPTPAPAPAAAPPAVAPAPAATPRAPPPA